MPKFRIMPYVVSNLAPNIAYIKFDTQNGIILEYKFSAQFKF